MSADQAVERLRTLVNRTDRDTAKQLESFIDSRITATNNAIAATQSLSSTQARGHDGAKRQGFRLDGLRIKGRYRDSRSEARRAEIGLLSELNWHLVELRKALQRIKAIGVGGNLEPELCKIENKYRNLEPSGRDWGPRPLEVLDTYLWNSIMNEVSESGVYTVDSQIASIINTGRVSCFDMNLTGKETLDPALGCPASEKSSGASFSASESASFDSSRSRGSSIGIMYLAFFRGFAGDLGADLEGSAYKMMATISILVRFPFGRPRSSVVRAIPW